MEPGRTLVGEESGDPLGEWSQTLAGKAQGLGWVWGWSVLVSGGLWAVWRKRQVRRREWSRGWARSSRYVTCEGLLEEVGWLGTQGAHSEFKEVMGRLGGDG